jgi:hypothetical protein
MRRFHSYGPVDCEEHFCVPRTDLVDRCVSQMTGHLEKGGHYFTLWSPRQCGKTWLMRQAALKIEADCPGRFTIGMISLQGVMMEPDEPEEAILKRLPLLFLESFNMKLDDPPVVFEDFKSLFLRENGVFKQPVILFMDEFDSLPPAVIDRLVTLFRDMYLKRESYLLHGLALIGVRAVLGVDSERGSPFNVQRSLHVPNLTPEEVTDLFDQYQSESGQSIEAKVVRAVYKVTRGQPGLVGWFGELLTETYNPGAGAVIGWATWEDVYRAALVKEWNNTVLNLVKKARGEYLFYVLELFGRQDLPFSIDAHWCGFLYLNGIIDSELVQDSHGQKTEICRFSCPFIQQRLFNALTMDLIGDRLPLLALDPLDGLDDVFDPPELNLPALLARYKAYLQRLKARGIHPWKDQPRRTDLRLTEAVGHFHLYFWLQCAIGRRCAISPEFPTGNGRVDLHLRCRDRQGLIEVKSFTDLSSLRHACRQAGHYARKLALSSITLAVFVPLDDDAVLDQLSRTEDVEGVRVHVAAIGWT